MNRRTGSLVAAILATAAIPTAAQWLNYPTPGVPKTADGRPNLNAPTPRTPAGHPDLSGLWKPQNTMRIISEFDRVGTFFDLGTGMNGGLPYQPWAAERVRKNRENNFKDQPDGKCLPLSPTQSDTHNDIRRLIQSPEVVVLLFEKNTTYRTIHLDGRALEPEPEPSWRGYSVGQVGWRHAGRRDEWTKGRHVARLCGQSDNLKR